MRRVAMSTSATASARARRSRKFRSGMDRLLPGPPSVRERLIERLRRTAIVVEKTVFQLGGDIPSAGFDPNADGVHRSFAEVAMHQGTFRIDGGPVRSGDE